MDSAAHWQRYRIEVYGRVDDTSGDGSVFDADAPLLATLHQAPTPVFTATIDGPTPLILTVPMHGWRLSPAGFAVGGIATTHRVDIHVANRWTMEAESSEWSRRIYRGTIERIREHGESCTLTIMPLQRIAAGAANPGITLVGDTVLMARDVAATFLPSLGWDPRNPLLSGRTAATVTFEADTVLELLHNLAASSGAHWQTFITAAGTIRFFAESEGTRVHYLAEGREVAGDPELIYSSLDMATRVLTWYHTGSVGGNQVVQTSRYDPRDARDRQTGIRNLMTAANALARAEAELAEWGRETVEGGCTVLGDRHDIYGIEPGDTVYLQRRSDLPPGIARPDLANTPLHVSEIAYEGATARVSFDRRAPSAVQYAARTELAGSYTLRTVVVNG